MLLRKSAVFTLLLTGTGIVHAELEPILTIGYETGGDELVQTTTTDLNTGGGLALGVGAAFSTPGSSMSVRTMLYYLGDSVEFTSPDGEADTDSFPLEVGVFKRWQRHELGGGPTIHLNPSYEISSSSPLVNGTVDFDNATGVFLEYHYIFSQTETTNYSTDTYFALKLRSMDYESAGLTLDADSVGLYLGAKF